MRVLYAHGHRTNYLVKANMRDDKERILFKPLQRKDESVAKSARGKRKKPEELNIIIEKNLKEIRTSRMLTQEAIGKLIGVTFQQVQKYENGSNAMSALSLWKLSKTLKVPISRFFKELSLDKKEGL